MLEKIQKGEAIDLSKCQREGRYYVVPSFIADRDYCDAATERWIWSIGKRRSDGVILASIYVDLYEHPDFECVWLR